jgi:hypothetical protein
MWALYINLEGTPKAVTLHQKYLDCARAARAYAHKVPLPEKRNYYQPWYFCRKELVNPPATPPHIVR